MAKVKLSGVSARNIKLELDSEGLVSRKKKKKIAKLTVGSVNSFITKDYNRTVNTILGLYAGVGLSRNSYKTKKVSIRTAYPEFSNRHSAYILSKGLDPKSKPFWGAITGDLAKYARKVRITDSADISPISFKEEISKSRIKNFFSKIFTGEKAKIKIISLSASISLPTLSSELLDSAISKNYLQGLTGGSLSLQLSKPRAEPKLGARPEHAIWGEENVRPLIRPVARHLGDKAILDLLSSLDVNLRVKIGFFS